MTKRPFLDVFPYERFKFDKEQLGIAYMITRKQLANMKGWEIEQYETDMGRELVMRVTMMMAHGDRTMTATEDVPITWWDHVKLDINLWALERLKRPRAFFHPARLIAYLPITPKFRRIESSILVKRFCPHVGVGDNRPHIEFMMHKPMNYGYLADDRDDENDGLPYGGTGY